MANYKVGVVIVSYNASNAVQVTLESLRLAKNKTKYEVILIDNASEEIERDKIKNMMNYYSSVTGGEWKHIQQEKNLGFSGGNNIGIDLFIDNDEISHVCLLNSDVIVSDYWLDRLIEKNVDIISSVTNKADGEQCIPVDYKVELNSCLNFRGELNSSLFNKINSFSEKRYKTWKGHVVDSDITFFCVLLTRKAILEIGRLDEKFFPGGFEDDDYLIRARNLGYSVYLARDVFIHHWGSASFGQLQYEYFSGRAAINKEYLEQKHSITWKRRPEKPFVSFKMDILYALNNVKSPEEFKYFILEYIDELTTTLNYFDEEFNNILGALRAASIVSDNELQFKITLAEEFGDIKEIWNEITLLITKFLHDKTLTQKDKELLLSKLDLIIDAVYHRVDCNFAMHRVITAHQKNIEKDEPSLVESNISKSPVPQFTQTKIEKVKWFIKHAISFIIRFDGIVFFGGYPYPERQSDGYFQRIQIIDRLFTDRWRVYVESDELKGRDKWFDRPESKVLVLRITGGNKRKLMVRMLALISVLRCRKIYFHSVLRMRDNLFGRLMYVPFIKKALDVHGVVPEEFRMHSDFYSAVLYEKEEQLAVNKAGLVIVVTDAMKSYLTQKFRDSLKADIVSFPMFPTMPPTLNERPYIDGKPVVVYAGGLHKWQQVSKMIDAMSKTINICHHRFYCPQPDIFMSMLPHELKDKIDIQSKSHDELTSLYAECHYGFILRENIIVNNVACPTKLVEYLAMGILPIVDCEDIGDFKSLGMKYIRLSDFLLGNLPDPQLRMSMVAENFSVYEKLKCVRKVGSHQIYDFFTNKSSSSVHKLRNEITPIIYKLLPVDTFRGEFARLCYRTLKGKKKIASSIDVSKSSCSSVNINYEYDLIVQVDNFEAGGLENVVLELNEFLMENGYRVLLLVLGTQGVSVQRARDIGMSVHCMAYSNEAYIDLLQVVKPKIVMTHYSINGVGICHENNIPFIQVIHNLYMWFNPLQKAEFKRAAELTKVFVAVSSAVKNYSVSKLAVPEEKCIVISNGINFEPFDKIDRNISRLKLRTEFSIAEDAFVYIDVGAINHQKNHIAVLRAFKSIATKCPDSVLVIIGPAYEPDLLREIEEFILVNDLVDRAYYCGQVKNVDEFLAMSDAFVSGTIFEGGPLTLLEAVKSDLPVIMPNVGLASDFYGKNGFEIIDRAVDIENYDGPIWSIPTRHDYESDLADAMVRVYCNPVTPQLSADEFCNMNKDITYSKYRDLVDTIISISKRAN